MNFDVKDNSETGITTADQASVLAQGKPSNTTSTSRFAADGRRQVEEDILGKVVFHNGKPYVPAGIIAKEFNYALSHVSLLSRQQKIDAVWIGKRWYVDRDSVIEHRNLSQRNKTLGALKSHNAVPSIVPLSSSSEEHLSNRANLLKTAMFALSLGGLLISGGLYYDIVKVDTGLLKNRSADILNNISDDVSALPAQAGDILDPLRNFVRKYLLPEYGPETYLVVDPYKLREEKIKEQGERISALENQISNFQFSIFNQAPISNDQTKKTTIIKEVTVGPSGTTLTLLEQRLDNTVSLIEATRINLSNLAGDFTNFQRITPTTIQLPSTNTKGVGPLTLNPDTLDAKTLKISGGTTLEGGAALNSTLSVVSNLTVDTNTLYVDATNNRVGIGTSSPETTFELVGIASISGDVTIGGTLTALGNIGIGTTSAPNELTVIGSGSFTGQLKATRNPTQAHTGTWPSFTNTNDSTLYINPSSSVADGNVIAYVSGSDPKFLVDAEGDIYGNNLILQGSTSTGTTTIAGDLSVEGNSTFGDASTDKIKFRAPIL
ncbi:MAG TPA: hypothetical protein VJ046_02980, partial [Candidatus Paceibacterota bacterium]|nr:hypothetical protein [Candidatus Paceibacterota bacterium]